MFDVIYDPVQSKTERYLSLEFKHVLDAYIYMYSHQHLDLLYFSH